MKIEVITHGSGLDDGRRRVGQVLQEYKGWMLVKFKNYREGISINDDWREI